MTWIIHPTDVAVPHYCSPPGERSIMRLTDFPEVICVSSSVKGALWECDDCGQCWQGKQQFQWWPISTRAANRARRRHQRSTQ